MSGFTPRDVNGAAGPPALTSDLGSDKTVIVTGLVGSVVIEASADGLSFFPVSTVSQPTQVISVAASHMRVLAETGSAASVNVLAEQSVIRTVASPVSSTPGPPLDVSAFGPVASFYVDTAAPPGSIGIEISTDGVDFVPFTTFKAPGVFTEKVSARFMRTVGLGAAGTVAVASEQPVARALNSPAPTFVFRPGAVRGGNVYTEWPALVDAMSSVEGRKILEFDDSVETCRIPEGTWVMTDVMWAGFGPRPAGRFRTVVEIMDRAIFTGLRMIGGQITIKNLADTIIGGASFRLGLRTIARI